MLQKFLDFEDRALAVFRQDAFLLLGDLPPAMQPFLYCLAHPGTAAWASRYGFQAMQSLDTCPSYVRVLAAFKVPADPHLEPSLSRLTQKAELAGLQLPDRAPRAPPDDLIDSAALQRQALLKLLGTSAPTPDKSPGRLSSLKKTRLADAPPRKALDFGAELPDAPLAAVMHPEELRRLPWSPR